MIKSYKSARGVYYDLNKSPYFYEDKKGNKFLFSSFKKYTMFIARLKKHLGKLGYEVNKSYLDNIEDLPKKVYNQMIYK